MSGEKRNNVTVKMNGRFWDEKRDDAKSKESVKDEKVPRKRTPIPFPTQPLVQNGNEAWDRLIQMRGRAERETSREPGISLEETEHVEVDLGENVFSKKPATRLFSTMPKGPIMRTVVSTGGAIAIGLLFGFLVLTVFSEKELSQSYRNVLGDTVQTLTAQGPSEVSNQPAIAGPVLPGVDRPVADSPATTSGTPAKVNVQLPEVKMFVAQAGVFQPDTSAQAATEPLDKLSIPHLLYKDSAKQYMFAAAAPTRDAVLGFAANLKNKGVDVYVKEFSFPAYQGTVAVNAVASSSTQPDLQSFFANGVKLAQTLSAHSGQVITNAQPVLSQEEAAAMKEQHRQFLEKSRLVQSQAGGSPYFSGMVNGINQAMDARDKMAEANAGKKSQSAESYAWQVQAGILGYLENYAAWVQQAQKPE
ncbi:hypothetical protein AN963_03120 [Brevibacillus choshinensis]|uniref:SPOR domain-containing protein n=1 Tax=Brevibacillus choshinensis TaxID=54911 RepID=A0ABR5NB91_BRECH|nr:hypothetical protein AN963_03120 [Brevibacillus choshinensis]